MQDIQELHLVPKEADTAQERRFKSTFKHKTSSQSCQKCHPEQTDVKGSQRLLYKEEQGELYTQIGKML